MSYFHKREMYSCYKSWMQSNGKPVLGFREWYGQVNNVKTQ
jgi:hypothetical protein